MAFELTLTKERMYELLELTVANGARPVIVIEDFNEKSADDLINLIFSERKDTVVFEYNDFIMNQAFDVQEINRLGNYCFVVIKGVKYLYGKSATAKILADFVKRMIDESTGVIFTGKRAMYDMAEFAELAGQSVNYLIKLEKEDE